MSYVADNLLLETQMWKIRTITTLITAIQRHLHMGYAQATAMPMRSPSRERQLRILVALVSLLVREPVDVAAVAIAQSQPLSLIATGGKIEPPHTPDRRDPEPAASGELESSLESKCIATCNPVDNDSLPEGGDSLTNGRLLWKLEECQPRTIELKDPVEYLRQRW